MIGGQRATQHNVVSTESRGLLIWDVTVRNDYSVIYDGTTYSTTNWTKSHHSDNTSFSL